MRAAHLVRSLLSTGVALAFVVVGPAALAQDRLRAHSGGAADRRAEAGDGGVQGGARQRLSGPFVPLLRSPEVMNRARAMGDYLRFKSTLPPQLSEFLIILTAREWTQNYEWDAHARLALEAGVKSDTVNAIAAGRRPDAMTDDETLLYEFWRPSCTITSRSPTRPTRGPSSALASKASSTPSASPATTRCWRWC